MLKVKWNLTRDMFLNLCESIACIPASTIRPGYSTFFSTAADKGFKTIEVP
jgi:hypothetical protein